MRRGVAYTFLAIVILAFAGSLLLLNRYKVSLVHSVVKNAVLQKSPPEYRGRIEDAFDRSRTVALRQRRSQAYLQTLFAISQKVEKVQRISSQGVEEILAALDGFSVGR
ncbi:MAG TPA: hypothetical protein VGK99_19050 [Acidobacteriota bacterium]|jgi:hypothetical protein